MKEATGNLNMGVVTLTAIGVIAAFFFTVLWPSISKNFENYTSCDDAVCSGNVSDGKWEDCTTSKGVELPKYSCTYKG